MLFALAIKALAIYSNTTDVNKELDNWTNLRWLPRVFALYYTIVSRRLLFLHFT
jgi:hypothetical protein